MTPAQRDRYAAEFAPRVVSSPLQKLLDARQLVEASRQALRRAEHAEAVAAAEMSALATMCNAPTSRPPAPAPHDKYAGKAPHQVRGWQP